MKGRLYLERVSKGFCARSFFGRPKLSTYRPVVRDFSLEVNAGEVVALVGNNGVGKTTILKVAMGMFQPEHGKAWLEGKPAHCFDRQAVGAMLTHQMIYLSLTGWENLSYTAALYRLPDIRNAVARSVALWELEDFVKFPVQEYSQGMKTRLALARATLMQPTFLFLDEPFAFLDEENAIPLAIRNLRSLGISTLLTCPTLQQAAFADRVLRVVRA